MVTRSTELVGQPENTQVGTVARALGGLVLALAVAGGIAGWNLVHQRDAGTAVVPPAEVAPVVQELPRAVEPVVTVWVVGTQEQADLMREGLALATAVRVSGLPERYTVVVATTDTADTVLQALRDDARIGPLEGAAAVQVVDVRTAS
jgi:hypothetical protein